MGGGGGRAPGPSAITGLVSFLSRIGARAGQLRRLSLSQRFSGVQFRESAVFAGAGSVQEHGCERRLRCRALFSGPSAASFTVGGGAMEKGDRFVDQANG